MARKKLKNKTNIRNNYDIDNDYHSYNNYPYDGFNYYAGEGPSFLSTISGGNGFNLAKTFSNANMGNMLKGGLSSIGSAVGQVGNSLISGGLKSDAGKAISGIGNAAGSLIGKVNPVMGAAVSAASGIVGGLANRAFGSKLNQEEINKINDSNTQVGKTIIDNSSFDAINNQWKTQDMGQDFSMSDIGKDGWFSNKAKKKYNELLTQQNAARNKALTSYDNAAFSADLSNDLNAAANFSAYGGPLNLFNDGGIYIKPENRGKFTALKERTGKSSTWYKEHGTPEQRKMATFALNAAKWHALGGPLSTNGGDFTNGVREINNGGSHEINPLEGVPMGIDPNGTPNLVEEGELIYNDYVYSKRLKANDEVLKEAGLPISYKGKSFADIAKSLEKESKERPNDPISKKGLQDSMQKLQNAQEIFKQQRQEKQMINQNNEMQYPKKFWPGGPIENKPISNYVELGFANDFPKIDSEPSYMDWNEVGKETGNSYVPTNLTSDTEGISSSKKVPWWRSTTTLRYAPAVGAGIGFMQNLLSKPDYSYADKIEATANEAGNYMPVTYNPLTNYLSYNPLDRNYYTNKLSAQAGATRRALMNTTSPSRNASLLAADYNAQNQLGTLARQAEEYNQAQRQNVETFNRGTNQANSEMALKAAMANQSALANARNSRLSGVIEAMKMRNAIDSARGASYSTNLTNFFNSLGNIGIDAYNRRDRNNLIKTGHAGAISDDMLPQEWGKAERDAYRRGLAEAAKAQSNKKACGGHIINRRRRK